MTNPELDTLLGERLVDYGSLTSSALGRARADQRNSGMTLPAAIRELHLVGEIRDADTADIALKAALTGHLVLSTPHTNDAPGAILRLLNMGLEPFLVASSLRLVVAQRLLRRLCRRAASRFARVLQNTRRA